MAENAGAGEILRDSSFAMLFADFDGATVVGPPKEGIAFNGHGALAVDDGDAWSPFVKRSGTLQPLR
ncbi:hypothetical protein WA026_007040 [Henosepilachna vigintioctopunctata]|uniref:Uncharacterized protein n=1 Tax=Henosepilachna vigintioctopunctata TaxID=420089 RepID=A0AAW1V1S4_9CUCU